MKKTIMCIIGSMMILSLAACTPTTEKEKSTQPETTAVATTDAGGPGVVKDRPIDLNEPDVDVVALYTLNEDGTKVVGTLEAVETLDAQSLVDLLIQYEVLEEGTTVVNYKAEGEAASEIAGPGMTKSAENPEVPELKEYGTLELNQFPSDKQKLRLEAVSETFTESMEVLYMTITADGKTLMENGQIVE